jgi:hypothetical protein
MPVSYNEEEQINLVQQHYDWAKKFICKNKAGYLQYINSYVKNSATRSAINSIKEDLPVYIHKIVLKNLSKIS